MWDLNQPHEGSPQIAGSLEYVEEGHQAGQSVDECEEEECDEEEEEEYEEEEEVAPPVVQLPEFYNDSVLQFFQRLNRQIVEKEDAVRLKWEREATAAAMAVAMGPARPQLFQGYRFSCVVEEVIAPRKWRDLLKRRVVEKRKPLVLVIGDKMEIVHRVDNLDETALPQAEERKGSMEEVEPEETRENDVQKDEATVAENGNTELTESDEVKVDGVEEQKQQPQEGEEEKVAAALEEVVAEDDEEGNFP